MGEILLHNTLSNRKETLQPLHPGEVRMYTCGPTVYDFAHIGNFRTFVFQDVLRRYLKSRGFRVIQVMNLTDVDDRIIQKAAAAGVSIREYTDKYSRRFWRMRRAESGAAGTYRARHRAYRRHGEADPAAHDKGLHVHERRLDVLPHREISGVRQTFKN